MKPNEYGSLCTEMYELLHPEAPADEWAFYESFARKGDRILEPLCGSGRFLIPFLKKGFSIRGVDNSGEMLGRLKEKAPQADLVCVDLETYRTADSFDYILIPSGSICLFTQMETCKSILSRLKSLLRPEGRLVFAVDTVDSRCPDDPDYKTDLQVTTEEGYTLLLKTKNTYDPVSRTQYSPGIYELYDGQRLLRQEAMDFRTHLYQSGEMEALLAETGFSQVTTYYSFAKDTSPLPGGDTFLFLCRL